MTPRLFHALRKRELAQMRREEVLCGIIAATTANFAFSPPKPPLSPEAFMIHNSPEHNKSSADEQQPRSSGDGLLAALQALPAGTAIQMEAN
jgi:hypothetical protein